MTPAELTRLRERVAALEAENARLAETVRKGSMGEQIQNNFFREAMDRAEKAESALSRANRQTREWIAKYDESGRALLATVAECDALRADALRYRWLRDGAEDNADVSVKVKGELYYGPAHSYIGPALDAAIDAAREKP